MMGILRTLAYVCIGCACFGLTLGYVYGRDSLRMEKRGAYWFVVHRVAEGETIYGLSRRYAVQIADIYKHNPSLEAQGLRLGEELFLLKQALHTTAANEVPHKTQTKKDTAQFVFHEVQAGESLYGIARQYGVGVEMLRNWNHLPDYTVYAGSRLSIFRASQVPLASSPKAELPQTAAEAPSVADAHSKHQVVAGETLYRIALNYGIALGELMRWNELQISDTLRIGQWLRLSPPSSAQMAHARTKKRDSSPVIPNPSVSSADTAVPRRAAFSRRFRSRQIVQEGFAVAIPHSDNAQQYYALHKSAPVGTFIRVKNQINARIILVRVIGELPDIESNESSIIYITQKAYAQLGVPDARCPVEISYFSD